MLAIESACQRDLSPARERPAAGFRPACAARPGPAVEHHGEGQPAASLPSARASSMPARPASPIVKPTGCARRNARTGVELSTARPTTCHPRAGPREAVEHRHLRDAGRAPGRPEVQQQRPAAQFGQHQLAAIGPVEAQRPEGSVASARPGVRVARQAPAGAGGGGQQPPRPAPAACQRLVHGSAMGAGRPSGRYPALSRNSRRNAAASPRQLRPRASGLSAPRRSSWSRTPGAPSRARPVGACWTRSASGTSASRFAGPTPTS